MESPYAKLPPELREEVLARVDCIAHLLQLRLVCKAWNSLITSHAFAKLQWQTTAPHPWLIVIRRVSSPNQKLYLCDRSMERWLLPPLPFLKELECDFSTCKSSGGLVCCVAGRPKRGPKSILVFNPITRAFRLLPSPPYPGLWSKPALDLALWRKRGSSYYKVAVCDAGLRDVRVFDSRKGFWKDGGRPPDAAGMKPRLEGYRNSSKEKLYWYDIEREMWVETKLPTADPFGLKCPSVIKAEGGTVRLAAVLAMADGGRHASVQGFGVWELQKQKKQQNDGLESHCCPDVYGKEASQNCSTRASPRQEDRQRHNKMEHGEPSQGYGLSFTTHHEVSKKGQSNVQASRRPCAISSSRGAYEGGSTTSSSRREYVGDGHNRPLHNHQPSPLLDARRRAFYGNPHLNSPNALFHPARSHHALLEEDGSTWIEISRTPPRFLRGPRGVLHRLNDSSLVCHQNYVCMTGVIRFSLSPWDCFYPWLLIYNPSCNTWDWSPHPLGDKTWANFHAVCVIEPNLHVDI